MKQCYDIERSLQRVSLRKCGPRDLSAISHTIGNLDSIINQLHSASQSNPVPAIVIQMSELSGLNEQLRDLYSILSSALVESPPISIYNGGFVKKGYCKKLDQIQKLHSESKEITGRLQSKYKSMLGINTLKIKSNLVLGMHIEVPTQYHQTTILKHNQKIQKLQQDTNSTPKDILDIDELLSEKIDYRHLFIHCQTMPALMRYKTEEISSLDSKIQRAEFEVKEIEERIFEELIQKVLEFSNSIRNVAGLLAKIDVSSSLGLLAKVNNFCRPVITTENAVDIRGGRHPVVEMMQQLRKQTAQFTPNDMIMNKDSRRVFLLTGPNMGGKSTYLRQVAIHAILAQSGSFIPASSAKIGIFDRIFSRVGAADDLKNDQSTFMMEMQEAASILKMATPKSLVIVDELGRGTSTMEGLAIAWAVVEQLHNITKCRTIFATHYHELAKLAEYLPSLHCYQMQIKENQKTGVIAFLHKVIEGVADKSYGVHVAKLAGVPKAVTDRAELLLQELMNNSSTSHSITNISVNTPQLPAFPELESGVAFTEDENATYIKIDKKENNFAAAYDVLCKISLDKE